MDKVLDVKTRGPEFPASLKDLGKTTLACNCHTGQQRQAASRQQARLAKKESFRFNANPHLQK